MEQFSKITKNRITKLAGKTNVKIYQIFLMDYGSGIWRGCNYVQELSKFAKDNENLKLIGGIMDNEVLDQAGVQNVANLPTLDEAKNIIGYFKYVNFEISKYFACTIRKNGQFTPRKFRNTT